MNLQNSMKYTLQIRKQKQLWHQTTSHHKVDQQSPQQARWRQPRVLQKRPPLPLNPQRGVHNFCTLGHLLPPLLNDVEPMIMTDLPLTLLTTHLLLYRFIQGKQASRGCRVDSWTPSIHCLELPTSQSKLSTKASVKMPYLPHLLTVG